MLSHHRNDDCRIFAPLTAMYTQRKSVREFTGIGPVIFDKTAIYSNRHGLFGKIHAVDMPNIPVEDFLIIVVTHLDDLIADTENSPTSRPLSKLSRRIEGRL